MLLLFCNSKNIYISQISYIVLNSPNETESKLTIKMSIGKSCNPITNGHPIPII